MKVPKRSPSDSVFNAFEAGMRSLSALLIVPLLVRLLGLEIYGQWVLALAIASLLLSLQANNLPFTAAEMTAAESEAAWDERFSRGVSLAVLLGLVGAFACLVLGVMVNLWFGAESPWAMSLMILSLFVLAKTGLGPLNAALHSLGRYRWKAVLATIESLSFAALAALLCFVWPSPVSVAAARATSTVGSFVLARWSLRSELSSAPPLSAASAMVHGRGFLPMSFAGVGSALFAQVDRLVVGAAFGSAGLGLYGAVTTSVQSLQTLTAHAVEPLAYKAGLNRSVALSRGAVIAVVVSLAALAGSWTLDGVAALIVLDDSALGPFIRTAVLAYLPLLLSVPLYFATLRRGDYRLLGLASFGAGVAFLFVLFAMVQGDDVQLAIAASSIYGLASMAALGRRNDIPLAMWLAGVVAALAAASGSPEVPGGFEPLLSLALALLLVLSLYGLSIAGRSAPADQ